MSLKEVFEQQAEPKKERVERYEIHGVKVDVVPSEKQFAQDLFDSLAKIPTGRQAIEDMKRFKVGFFLEADLGTAGGYFDPMANRIVMSKSRGMDFMEPALVHEARHLLQEHTGRRDAERQNPDYASRLMINRATEADAQTQAIKACKEWEAIGHTGPIKGFEERYKPLVDAYNKNNSLSDAFKGWYDDERITAAYEQGYDVEFYLSQLGSRPYNCERASLKPADIARFCGGDRVDGFEEFLESDKARQVHLLTKTAVELYDESAAAQGGERDPSIAVLPVRDLKDNPAAQMYADKYIAETREKFNPEKSRYAMQKTALCYAMAAVDAVEKINAAAKNGARDAAAEKDLATAKSRMGAAIKRRCPQNRTAQTVALIKKSEGR